MNLSEQDKHSRRLLTCRPSEARRESITFVSLLLQKGQRKKNSHPLMNQKLYTGKLLQISSAFFLTESIVP